MLYNHACVQYDFLSVVVALLELLHGYSMGSQHCQVGKKESRPSKFILAVIFR